MKRKHLHILFIGMLTCCLLTLEQLQSRTRASDDHASARTEKGDESTETKLVGRVTLAGPAPKNHTINMATDPVCSKSHLGPATSEEVVTGPDNTIANVLVYVSEGLAGRTFEAPQQPVVIEQKGCLYHPHVTALEVGQKLLVENSDRTVHNIHPQPSNNREWNKSQAQGVPPIEATFGREEIAIPVKCNIHSWMKGYIAVFKHPYFAVTGKDGKFVLKDLPPGNYTITAWHEQFGASTQRVTMAANETKELNFAFEALRNRAPH